MDCKFEPVCDSELAGQPWVAVATDDGVGVVFVAESQMGRADVLREGRAAFQRLLRGVTPPV